VYKTGDVAEVVTIAMSRSIANKARDSIPGSIPAVITNHSLGRRQFIGIRREAACRNAEPSGGRARRLEG